MKKLICLVVVFACFFAAAAVQDGENILYNGEFEADQTPFPEGWTTRYPSNVRYSRSGGPNGEPSIAIFSETQTNYNPTVAQEGFVLVAGEKYKLSAYIRTKNFQSKHGGIAVYNQAWMNDFGIKYLPETSDWKKYEIEAECMKSENGRYYISLFAVRMQGEIEFADVKLIATSPKGLEGSSSISKNAFAPRLVPIAPLLNKIPAHKPELSFQWFGRLEGGVDKYNVAISCNNKVLYKDTLTQKTFVASLKGLPLGKSVLTASVTAKDGGKEVYSAQFNITIIEKKPLDTSRVKRLNNLVSRLLLEKSGKAEALYGFVNPEDGWVLVNIVPAKASPALSVKVNGQEVIKSTTDRLEAFRLLPRGEYELAVSGAEGGFDIKVNAVPELISWAPCEKSKVPGNGLYNWEYNKKYCLKAWTSFSTGRINEEAYPESKEMGLCWITNCMAVNLPDVDTFVKRIESNKAMQADSRQAGITCDELFFNNSNIDIYSKALKKYDNPYNRLIYTWIVGKPGNLGMHADFLSTCVNVSSGRGKLLIEAYCHTQANEAEAKKYLDNVMVQKILAFNNLVPGINASTGFIFGTFNQPAVISLEHMPDVDYKYYLDMQLNLLANHPAFDGIRTTGFWGTYHGEDEFQRWSFTLLRHYAVDGNTDMLSPEYGFTYNTGYVKNADFENGLKEWTLVPASKDSITTGERERFGYGSEARWGATAGIGDKFCVLKRQAGLPNIISQKATGLVPGRTYQFQYLAADYKDVQSGANNPKELGLSVTLEGADIVPELSFLYIDKRAPGKNMDGHARVNLRRIVFKATKPEMLITFSDEKAAAGDEIAFNFVQLKPYYSN